MKSERRTVMSVSVVEIHGTMFVERFCSGSVLDWCETPKFCEGHRREVCLHLTMAGSEEVVEQIPGLYLQAGYSAAWWIDPPQVWDRTEAVASCNQCALIPCTKQAVLCVQAVDGQRIGICANCTVLLALEGNANMMLLGLIHVDERLYNAEELGKWEMIASGMDF